MVIDVRITFRNGGSRCPEMHGGLRPVSGGSRGPAGHGSVGGESALPAARPGARSRIRAAGPSGPDPSGPDPSGPDPSGPDPSGPDPSGPDPSGPGPSGPDPARVRPGRAVCAIRAGLGAGHSGGHFGSAFGWAGPFALDCARAGRASPGYPDGADRSGSRRVR